jgi:hypothetical protein
LLPHCFFFFFSFFFFFMLSLNLQVSCYCKSVLRDYWEWTETNSFHMMGRASWCKELHGSMARNEVSDLSW